MRTGPFAGYAAIADYPPLGPFLLWLAVSIGRSVELPDFVALKLAIGLFQMASALIVLVRYRSWMAACLLWLLITPFGLLLGYLDAFYLPFVLLAVFAMEHRQFALGGVLLAIAGLIKWQPVVLAPVILIYALDGRWSARTLGWVAPTAICVPLIVAVFGPAATAHAFLGAADDPYFSGQAFNLDWIVTGWLEMRHATGVELLHGNTIVAMSALNPSWRILSRDLFWLAYLGALAIFAVGRRDRLTLLLALTTCEAAQFTFNTGVHENHMFLVMCLAFVACYGGALSQFYLTTISALAVSNVLFFYGLNVGSGAPAAVGTVLLSALNVIVCLILVCLLGVSCRRTSKLDALAPAGHSE